MEDPDQHRYTPAEPELLRCAPHNRTLCQVAKGYCQAPEPLTRVDWRPAGVRMSATSQDILNACPRSLRQKGTSHTPRPSPDLPCACGAVSGVGRTLMPDRSQSKVTSPA